MERAAAAAFEWVEVQEEDYFANGDGRTGRKRKTMMRRASYDNNHYNNKKKKIELVGWASRPLLHFLHSIGKDTSHPISHYDVASIINDYVMRNNLLHPTRKKRVLCDHSLLSLFGRKSIARVKIFDLLDPHLAENRLYDSSDDGDYDDGGENGYFEEEDDDVDNNNNSRNREEEKQQQSKPPPPKTTTPPKSTVKRSCFAAIIPDNIQLVYLRRSLVEHLLLKQKQEEKIVGSFVRTKSDPNDYLQKHSYVLLQVTGNTLLPLLFYYPFGIASYCCC